MLILTVAGTEPVAQQVRGDYGDYNFSSLDAAQRHRAWACDLAVHGNEDAALQAWRDFNCICSELTD
jgi:hypothetical protein